MDIQAALRVKDAELEQRGSLLVKTKAAIEHLQDELAGTRHEVDKWRRAAERQGADLLGAQREVQALQSERQLQEAQDGLRSAADGNSAQHTAVASRLKEAEQEVAVSHKEAKAVREQVAALQALVVDRKRGLAEQAGALQRLEKQRGQLEAANAKVAKQLAAAQSQAKEAAAAGEQAKRLHAAATRKLEEQLSKEAETRQQAEQDAAAANDALADEQRRQSLEVRAWERRFRELQQDAAERLQAREAAWATQREAAQRETVAAVEKVRRQQTKRLYLAEGEWALRLQQSSAEWAAKLDAVNAEALQRCKADKATWEAHRAQLLRDVTSKLAEAEQAAQAAVEQMKQHYRRKLAAAESKAAEAAQIVDRVWQQHLEASAGAAQRELQAAVDRAAVTAAQQGQQVACLVAAARDASAAKLADLDKQWGGRVAAAEERGLREKQDLERQWADKQRAADRAATEAQAALRGELEARLAAVTVKVEAVAQQEVEQGRKRAGLLQRVAELEAAGEKEHVRRQEVEAALQEATSAFKRDLADKSQEIRFLRSCAGGIASAAPGSLPGLPMPGIPALQCYAPHVASPCLAAAPPMCSHTHSSLRTCCSGSPAHVHYISASAAASQDTAGLAARAVEAELRALQSARRAYHRAAVGQQDLANSVARTISEALKRDHAAADSPAVCPHSSAGCCVSAAGRRKWKRDLAAELGELC
ncbi:hypothetical protein D9Q98_000399 [Chlorella vulgaris]|uniref:Uncharacterized protein n=1 Tax=Chlorella vulgaris TaxID=3077 RepID=A0A9D4TYC2_CHLVU|nr:hypothetical protein D9Q98_000399 [Chlorella vulgaris]